MDFGVKEITDFRQYYAEGDIITLNDGQKWIVTGVVASHADIRPFGWQPEAPAVRSMVEL